MGFKTPDDTKVVSPNFQKATAFINLWLPSSDAKNGKKKFGTIYLDDKQEDQAAVIEYIQRADGNLMKLVETMIVDFQLANTKTGFTLPVDDSAQTTSG